MVKSSEQAIEAGLRAALKLKNGELPTEVELASAPVLTGWVLDEGADGICRLGGFVSGHPKLEAGWIWTSVVLFIEPSRNWARTVSRLYRLREPLIPRAD